MSARLDYSKYGNGCSVLDNFIATVQGPAKQRPGNPFVAEVKDSTKRTYLTPFEVSVSAAYVVEIGDQYARFFTEHGQLQAAGVPVEIVTPYQQADLFNDDLTCRLRTAQSGDFLYLTHGAQTYAPQTLTRTSTTTFALAEFVTVGGPFKDTNLDNVTTVYASAETGAGITLTASVPLFLAGHVGALFYLESKDVNSIPAWEVNKAVTAGDRRRSDGKTYEALNSATTGTFKPVHTQGALFDGSGSVQWQFRDPGYGWVRITGAAGTTATADVVSRLPTQVVGAGNPTTRWAHAAWSAVEGFPTDVAFFRERLWFGRGSQLWASVASDFTDFSARNPSGEVAADQAISLTLASGKLNSIQWMLPDKELIVGTAGGEFSIGELSNGSPIGPGNVRVRSQSTYGSRGIVPVQAGATTLFVQRAGRKVREITYDSYNGTYTSNDRTALSEHITASGIVDMDYAQEPESVVWCARADGGLIGFTWNAEQNVWGWHRHTLGGAGKVEAIAVIPSPDLARNEPWMIVNRTINGTVRRYVEYQERTWTTDQPQQNAFYVDCGSTYIGLAVTTITGLDYLEGATVSILADGSPHPQRTVVAGSITLQAKASVVRVGYGMRARICSMRVEAGSRDGTAQGKIKRANRVAYRFDNTSTGSFGASEDALDDFTFRKASDPMNEPVPPFTGDRIVSWPGGYKTDAFFWYVNDKPLASTLVGIFPALVSADEL